MQWLDIISEAPIGDIHTHGDFSQPGSLRKDDLSLSTPKRQDKIRRVLEKSPVLIDLHFVNQAHPVDMDFHLDPVHVQAAVGLISPEDLRHYYNIDITPRPNAINIVTIQNEGDDRVPMTPWIIAHRIGHLLYYTHPYKMDGLFKYFYGTLDRIQDEYRTNAGPYDVSYAQFASVFGTTRACRDGLIRTGRVTEWVYDCFAQMCVMGTIRFNPAPAAITEGKLTFKLGDAAYVDRSFDRLRDRMLADFTAMLHGAVGQIAVF